MHNIKRSSRTHATEYTAAVISVGAHNTFGHPAQSTIDLLNRTGVKVYRTDLDGAVIIQTDGYNLEVRKGKKTG
jgi:competence protein ComEC